jgi:hypothetical protein
MVLYHNAESRVAHTLETLSGNWSDLIPATRLYVCCWLAILGACILRAAIGVGGVRVTHDLFCFLDGGWRVLQGQAPYKDFTVDFGSFVLMIAALGLRLTGGRAEGLGVGQAILGLVIAVWAWMITQGRLRPLLRVLFCVNVVFVTIAPYILGDPPNRTAPSGIYNRDGTALMALVMAESMWARDSETGRSRFFGGFSTGCAMALALFVKVTYFFGAGLLIVGLIPCLRQTKLRWVGLSAGAAATVLPFWIDMGGTFTPMVKVLMQLAAAKQIAINWCTLSTLTEFVAPLACFALLAAALRSRDGAPREACVMMVSLAAVSEAGMFFQLTNDPTCAFPLGPPLAILLLQFLVPRNSHSLPPNAEAERWTVIRPPVVLLLVSWACILTVASIAQDGASLVCGTLNRRWNKEEPGTSFHATALSSVVSLETDYVARINDGIDLLRAHLRPGDTVCSLDYSNPFEYALGLAPFPGGTSAGFRYGFDFTDTSRPSPESILGGARLVMAPEMFTDRTLVWSIPRIYGGYVHNHFHLEARSRYWRMYRHNQ